MIGIKTNNFDSVRVQYATILNSRFLQCPVTTCARTKSFVLGLGGTNHVTEEHILGIICL